MELAADHLHAVALMLLFLLAVAAIPGSVVPQQDVNPLLVSDFRQRNPGLVGWYDRLGLLDALVGAGMSPMAAG